MISIMENNQNTVRAQRQVVEEPAGQIWTPLFILISLTALFFSICSMGLNTGSTVYLARIDSPTWVVGMAATSFSISAAVVRLVIGHLIDKWGRYLVIATASIVFVVTVIAPLARLGGEAFLAMRVAQGLSYAMVTTTAATMASDVLPMSRLGEGLGFYGLAQAIAMAIGPATALFVVDSDPAENMFITFAIIALCGCIMALQCRYERKPEMLPATCGYRKRIEEARKAALEDANDDKPQTGAEQAHDEVARHRSFGQLLGTIFEKHALCGAVPVLLYSPVVGFCIYFVGLLASEMGLANGGLFYTMAAVAMIAVRMSSHLFMDRVAPIKIFGAGLSCGMVGMALLLFACTSTGELRVPLFYAAGFAYGICNGLGMPLNQAVAVKNTPPDRWGAANGLLLLSFDVGLGGSAVIWAFINDIFGYAVSVEICMAMLVLTFAAAFFMYPKDNGAKS